MLHLTPKLVKEKYLSKTKTEKSLVNNKFVEDKNIIN